MKSKILKMGFLSLLVLPWSLLAQVERPPEEVLDLAQEAVDELGLPLNQEVGEHVVLVIEQDEGREEVNELAGPIFTGEVDVKVVPQSKVWLLKLGLMNNGAFRVLGIVSTLPGYDLEKKDDIISNSYSHMGLEVQAGYKIKNLLVLVGSLTALQGPGGPNWRPGLAVEVPVGQNVSPRIAISIPANYSVTPGLQKPSLDVGIDFYLKHFQVGLAVSTESNHGHFSPVPIKGLNTSPQLQTIKVNLGYRFK